MSNTLENEKKKSPRKSIIFLDPSIASSVPVESRTSSGRTISVKRFIIEVAKQRNEVKTELSKLCEEFNLLIFIIYILFCINWCLIGIQWYSRENIIVPELECNIKELENSNWNFYEKRNITSPNDNLYVPGCVYYNADYLYLRMLTYEEAADHISKMKKKPRILKCRNYTIKFDIPKEISFYREFNLYCLKKSLLSTKLYGYIGLIVFGFPCGILADIYGRRPVYFFGSIILNVSAFILTCSTSFIAIVLANFFVWGSLISVNMMLSIIYSEIFVNRYRTATTVISFSFLVIGVSLISILKFYDVIEVWRLRKLTFALSALILLFGIIIVPESPKFFIKNKEFKKAWKSLQELGDDENPDAEDYKVFKPPLKYHIKYQLKVLTTRYLLNRVYIIIFLNGVATIYNVLYLKMENFDMTLKYKNLQIEMLIIQVFVFIVTGLTSVYYSKKVLLSTYFLLLCVTISVNTITKSNMAITVSSLAGYIFFPQIYILAYTYLLEIIPTSHRATCLGFYLSVSYILEAIIEMFQEELSWKRNTQFYSIFYSVLCIVCILLAFVAPDHGLDLPDKIHDVLLKSPLQRASS